MPAILLSRQAELPNIRASREYYTIKASRSSACYQNGKRNASVKTASAVFITICVYYTTEPPSKAVYFPIFFSFFTIRLILGAFRGAKRCRKRTAIPIPGYRNDTESHGKITILTAMAHDGMPPQSSRLRYDSVLHTGSMDRFPENNGFSSELDDFYAVNPPFIPKNRFFSKRMPHRISEKATRMNKTPIQGTLMPCVLSSGRSILRNISSSEETAKFSLSARAVSLPPLSPRFPHSSGQIASALLPVI